MAKHQLSLIRNKSLSNFAMKTYNDFYKRYVERKIICSINLQYLSLHLNLFHGLSTSS